ncbi:MAG TPA: DNA polymerase III subunit delta [Hellea balneolensis]|uniref:DNA-directed DNA polymerase n=1 Tax=Hellea balneolensis TaxID=287478 RepID=A0A7V5NWK4_9PROT|nr:DNA polymerase III subunit delta [Hellea balneolensis]
MKLSGARATAWLRQAAQDCPGLLLFGPDAGLCAERAERVSKQWISDPDDAFAVTVLSADDLASDPARLADEMVAQSLLGETRLIRVRLSHEKSGAALAKAIKVLDERPETCAARLIMEAGDLPPRSAIRKAFEAAKHFIAIPCYADSQADIAGLVRTTLDDLNIKIDRDGLDAFVPLLEGDRRLARSEIEKLALYKGYGQEDGAVVTLADIRAVAAGVGADGLDDIVFAAMSGQTSVMDASLRRALSGKTSAHGVLAALGRHITRLHQARVKMQSGASASEAMNALRPPVFALRKAAFAEALHIWPEPALARAIARSSETERAMKSTGAAAEALLGRLLLALSNYAARRRRS